MKTVNLLPIVLPRSLLTKLHSIQNIKRIDIKVFRVIGKIASQLLKKVKTWSFIWQFTIMTSWSVFSVLIEQVSKWLWTVTIVFIIKCSTNTVSCVIKNLLAKFSWTAILKSSTLRKATCVIFVRFILGLNLSFKDTLVENITYWVDGIRIKWPSRPFLENELKNSIESQVTQIRNSEWKVFWKNFVSWSRIKKHQEVYSL